VAIMAEGDLSATMITKLEEVGVIIRYLPDVRYENLVNPAWELNFIKLNMWLMIEWDSIIYIHPDNVVMQSIEHMFSFATDFAIPRRHIEVNTTYGPVEETHLMETHNQGCENIIGNVMYTL
jgi:alpha-N-acetylglucosamine transferase